MPRRPKVWFDFAYLTSLDAENAPREVFFLSEPAQQALSQLAEIVLWPTRWFNGDPEDSAVLAASIYEELKVPAHFDDLIPLLDDVETLLQELIDKELCCDTIDSVPGGDGIGGVDDSTLPPDVDRDGESLPPEYEGDPEAYDAYLCGQAQSIADSTDDAVDAVYKAILTASNIIVFATLVVLMFGNVIGMGIAAIVAGGYTLVTISEVVGYYSAFTELRELLGGGDPQGLVAQTQGELAGIHDDIVNAIYCANDAAAAAGALHDLVDANVTSGSYAALLKLTYSIAMRPIFWGYGGADDDGTCVCEGTPLGFWDWGTLDDGDATWQTRSGTTVDNHFLRRLTEGELVEKDIVVEAGTTEISLDLLCWWMGASGTTIPLQFAIFDRDNGDALIDAQVLQIDNFVDSPAPSLYEYRCDISPRLGSNIRMSIRLNDTAGGWVVRVYEGTGAIL